MTCIPPPAGIAMPYAPLRVLDLFAGAAGGWTLGLHRAGFVTVAACEIVPWRRVLYAENNPHVRLYDDIRALTAGRLVSDLGFLPDLIVGSHVRKRSWLIGHDPAQLADTGLAVTAGRDADGRGIGCSGGDEGVGSVRRFPHGPDGDATGVGCREGRTGRCAGADDRAGEPSCGDAGYADREPCATGQRAASVQGPDDIGAGRFRPHTDDRGGAVFRGTPVTPRDAADTAGAERGPSAECAGDPDRPSGERGQGPDRHAEPAAARGAGNAAHTHETGQPDGRVERCLRPAEITDDGRGDGWCDDGPGATGSLGRRAGAGDAAAEPWADWNGGPAAHLRLDDGLSAWLARTRVALGDGRRASAASLVVEAFGDAVVPDIPEAIGHAILRVEMALDAVFGRGMAGGVS